MTVRLDWTNEHDPLFRISMYTAVFTCQLSSLIPVLGMVCQVAAYAVWLFHVVKLPAPACWHWNSCNFIF